MSAANRRNASGLRQVSNTSKLSFNTEPPLSSLQTKEEEYKRLNAELEKKTANLVFEAEQVLKANEKLIHETDYLNKISDVNFRDIEDEKGTYLSNNRMVNKSELSQFKETINNLEDSDMEEIYEHNEIEDDEVNHRQRTSGTGIRGLVNKIVDDEDASENTNGFMPKSANEMSSVAQIRFLKAKLKVMQEEVDRFNAELAKKDEENGKLAQRCKDLDEDRARQLRISNSHQTQMDKFKKLNEEIQIKLNANEVQAGALKKENDNFKKDTKKTTLDTQHLELRLNRALEEIEKYKLQSQKSNMNVKDLNDQDKRRIEQLNSDNKRLQKQKTELIQAFKKQLKLIDILKKQKMHLEAAKILQFSEEEFINALEWNSTNPVGAGASSKPIPTSSRNQKIDPRQVGQRPPSGSSRRQIVNKGPVNVQKKVERSASVNSEMKPQNEHLMLDNLEYLDDDDDDEDGPGSYGDGQEGENHNYKGESNRTYDDNEDN